MYKLIVRNIRNKNLYDITTISHNIEHTTSILGQPGKFTCVIEKDPNNILSLGIGDDLFFTVIENKIMYKVFKGKIFTIGTDASEAYKIVAYDQTRYLKNEDTMIVSPDDKPMDIGILFEEICDRLSIGENRRKIKVNDSSHKLKKKLYQGKSYYDILKDAFDEYLRDSVVHPYFFVRDNFGVLELDEISVNLKDYIIGTESLLMDYKYEIDIDKNSYNKIKYISSDKDEGLKIDVIAQDNKNIIEWGLLQKLQNANGLNKLQSESLSLLDLQLSNKPVETVSLNALGVPDLNAGDGFRFKLDKINRNPIDMFILSATHHYEPNLHTMDLEVSGFLNNIEIPKQPVRPVIVAIIDGVYGNGDERKYKLKKDGGYTPDEIDQIQNEINKIYDNAEGFMKGEWGDINFDKATGHYIFTDEMKDRINNLGINTELYEKILKSDKFEDFRK